MKTPREILLGRHKSAEAKLDAVRLEVLQRELGTLQNPAPRTGAIGSWLQALVWAYRGHLAAMGAVWFLIALLRLSAGPVANLAAAIPKERIPSPAIILTSLRESRLKMMELLGSRETDTSKAGSPGPRSARRYEILAG